MPRTTSEDTDTGSSTVDSVRDNGSTRAGVDEPRTATPAPVKRAEPDNTSERGESAEEPAAASSGTESRSSVAAPVASREETATAQRGADAETGAAQANAESGADADERDADRTQVLAPGDGGRADADTECANTEDDDRTQRIGAPAAAAAAGAGTVATSGKSAPESVGTAESGEQDEDRTQVLAASDGGRSTTGEADRTEGGAAPATGGAESVAAQQKSGPAPRAATPVGSLHRRTQNRSYAPSAEAAPKPAPAQAKSKDAAARRDSLRLPIILAVIAVLLGGFAVFAGVKASAAGAGSSNEALTNDQGTKEVQQQVANSLNTMFTFDYKNPDKTQQDAAPLMTKNIGGDYATLMKVLKDNGPKAKLTLNSSVMTSGVQQLQGDRARVLALMSQTYTKGDGKSAQKAPTLGVVRVDAQKIGGKWKINGLSMLSS